MKKRIWTHMILLTSLSILLVSSVLCIILYNRLSFQVRTDLQARSRYFRHMNKEEVQNMLAPVRPGDLRITLVLPDGTVFFDNTAEADRLVNHLGRKEIEAALTAGEGSSRRFSDTLNTETFYYAIRLADGSVLRTAKSTASVWGVFKSVLPVISLTILIALTAAYVLAGRLARRIVEPLRKMDFTLETGVPYAELAPFAKTISEHRQRILADSEQLSRRTATINAIMTNMNEGVVLLDQHGRILSLNKSAKFVLDVRSPVEGQDIFAVFRSLGLFELVRAALAGTGGQARLGRHGREYRVIASPVTDTGVVLLFLDITDQLNAEKIRREFSANVTHELKTPLTSIYGHAEILKEGLIKEEDKPAFYSKIMDEASRLLTLIDDILLLSKLDENIVQDRFAQVDLRQVAGECARALGQKAADHRVGVQVEGEGSVWGSATLLFELFYNLISNGIKYNGPGGEVRVTISSGGGQTVVKVADNGIGIPPEDQRRIFERFYRSEKSRSKKLGGTGLGLAIVKHVVDTHQGRITVSSTPGVGTEFVIVFGGYS